MSGSRRLVVVDAGLLATVQDLGRRGVGAMGVSPSGAADRFSARAANRLVGNPDGAALVETTMTGAAFDSSEAMTIAVTGAEAPLWISGRRRATWRSWPIEPGERIVIGPAASGLRSYLAVGGGIDAPAFLGSASTDVGGGLGGRPLQPGDALHVAGATSPADAPISRDCPASAIPSLRPPFTLRALVGPGAARIGEGATEALFSRSFRGSARSSRQALGLEGAVTAGGGAGDAISAGVCAGCVQLPADGSPIVLLAEHQTTGGYPVVLCVITADVSLAAQVKPGDEVRFERAGRAAARDALGEAASRLASIRASAGTGEPRDDTLLGRGFFEGA